MIYYSYASHHTIWFSVFCGVFRFSLVFIRFFEFPPWSKSLASEKKMHTFLLVYLKLLFHALSKSLFPSFLSIWEYRKAGRCLRCFSWDHTRIYRLLSVLWLNTHLTNFIKMFAGQKCGWCGQLLYFNWFVTKFFSVGFRRSCRVYSSENLYILFYKNSVFTMQWRDDLHLNV